MKIHDLTSHMDLVSFTAPVMIPFCEVVLEFTLIVAFKIQISLLYLYITSVKTVTSVVHGLHNWKGLSIAFLSLLLAYPTFWYYIIHQSKECWVSSNTNSVDFLCKVGGTFSKIDLF